MRQKQYPDQVISQKRIYIAKKAPETLRRPFKRAYDRLSNSDKNIAREIIMKRGKILTLQQFSAMKNGKEPINLNRYDVISSVFKHNGIDAWSGELI